MKVIKLFCAGGMSTSMLVQKMIEEVNHRNLDFEISAHGVNDIFCGEVKADCILLGPQVGFQLNKVKTAQPNTPVAVIDMVAYGMMDGKKVVAQAIKMLEN